jgi:hypothetical protein
MATAEARSNGSIAVIFEPDLANSGIVVEPAHYVQVASAYPVKLVKKQSLLRSSNLSIKQVAM